MKKIKHLLCLVLSAALAAFSAACSAPADTNSSTSATAGLNIDSSAWNYDSTNNIYWQTGVSYCTQPQAYSYESMGIYVPGEYMNAVDNGDGTYTCTVNTGNTVNGYTADTAPIVMPVNTAGYSAQEAPSSYNYNEAADYIKSGFVYVHAGCRGRSGGTNDDGTSYDGGAPWGVVDLKAAIRYLRYNRDVLAGDTERIFIFGHSGGGAQSAVVGASGDSELYFEYLNSIGAAMTDKNGSYISDAVCGVMSWCPVTSLDYANEAYEWMMGQYSSDGTRADSTWTSALSDDLAEEFAVYINSLRLTDDSGNILSLKQTGSGIYTGGSYYDYLLDIIETSLNNFLRNTEFPYTSGGSRSARPDGMSGEKPDIQPDALPSADSLPELPDADASQNSGSLPDGSPPDNMQTPSGAPTSNQESVTYDTPQDYIESLNSDTQWISYDASSNTASITDIEAFVQHFKTASKSVGAFDDLERSQAENMVFGNGESDALHFDVIMTKLLQENEAVYSAFADYNASYAAEYEKDMNNTDSLGTSSVTRQNMYNPMYYICDYYDGNNTSVTAKYWRINSGITQSDTSLTTEMNLALALKACGRTESVDFTTVWEQGHTSAERTGDSTSNFIQWIDSCCK